MSSSIKLDKAAECIKDIVNLYRCGSCDKSEDLHRWDNCGHIVCRSCSAEDKECSFCLDTNESYNKIILDELLSQRVKNALTLMSTFEETFNLDVCKQNRISEQLKIEKEVFPECIQAPVKYFNKKKNNTLYNRNKENKPAAFFLGEETSPTTTDLKMEKSKYIQQWLDKANTPRKPFSSFNVNNQSLIIGNKNIKRTQILKAKQNIEENKHTFPKKKLKSLDKYLVKNTKDNIFNDKCLYKIKQSPKITIESKKQDESGIVTDDSCIIIDESQSIVVDKDELALQAVVHADQNDFSDYASLIEDENVTLEKHASKDINSKGEDANVTLEKYIIKGDYSKVDKNNDSKVYDESITLKKKYTIKNNYSQEPKESYSNMDNENIIWQKCTKKDVYTKVDKENVMPEFMAKDNYYHSKVPFFKKDNLYNVEANKNLRDTECIAVTIVLNVTNNKNNLRQSAAVQTDISEVNKNMCTKHSTLKNLDAKIVKFMDISDANNSLVSQDLFANEAVDELNKFDIDTRMPDDGNSPKMKKLKEKQITLSDSDSEPSHERLLVNAEVHRSVTPDGYGILVDLPSLQSNKRKRRGNRPISPKSSDSSSKENLDPNRIKKIKSSKKNLKNKKKT